MNWFWVIWARLGTVLAQQRALQVLLEQNNILEKQNAALEEQNSEKLQQILDHFVPKPAVGFEMDEVALPSDENENSEMKKENTLKKLIKGARAPRAQATVDLQLLDDGTGIATLTPIDNSGLPTPALPPGSSAPVFSSNNPAIVITSDPSDPSGLTAKFVPSTPPIAATGVVLSASATLPSGTQINASGQPIDVVGDPNAVTGFTMQESTSGPAVISVVISPTSATVAQGTTQQFTAVVTGDSSNAVNWSVSPSTGSGSVDQTGLYTPPTTPGGTCLVVATSQKDTTKSASAAVTF